MCLAAFSIGVSDRFPLVLAANRDEFFGRPASPLAWWSPDPEGPRVLSGRDLEAGGTWLGLGENGRLALLTNVREPALHAPQAPSRGQLVTDWLVTQDDAAAFRARHAKQAYNGYNLLAADVAQGHWAWTSNRADDVEVLGPGTYGLSNAALDTPWPKLVALKSRLGAAVEATDAMARSGASHGADLLAIALFKALADTQIPPDESLPQTGVARNMERLLAPAFINAPERGYGTRSSTVVITETTPHGHATTVYELTHSTAPDAVRPDPRLRPLSASIDDDVTILKRLPGLERQVLKGWPAG